MARFRGGLGPMQGTLANTVAPSLTGTATNGQTLSCTQGTWDAFPPVLSYARQWFWANTNSPISGATGATYVLGASDVGKTVKCVVSAYNGARSVDASSNTTVTVT